jgi:hypothetical protein
LNNKPRACKFQLCDGFGLTVVKRIIYETNSSCFFCMML